MDKPAIHAIGHIGICVADMERSSRFWCDGLGFSVLREWQFSGRRWRQILELEELDLRSRIIRRDQLTLELLCYDKPGHIGTSQRRPMNQLGFTHLAVWVNDLDQVAGRLLECGGTIVEPTRTVFDQPELRGKWLICTDPDGVRVELVHYPAGAP
ncbi:MAG: glyoxylase family protein [Gammaproteobacteria bacterium]|jgi:catechol 2,3-dioxygenase-like lactoylglutathione lyase family enzyme|nr:glyoxylase family protein [Gammaproteobacteria bacterium]